MKLYGEAQIQQIKMIKRLIEKNETGRAIDELAKVVDVEALKGKFVNLKRSDLQGVISQEQYEKRLDVIIADIVKIAKQHNVYE